MMGLLRRFKWVGMLLLLTGFALVAADLLTLWLGQQLEARTRLAPEPVAGESKRSPVAPKNPGIILERNLFRAKVKHEAPAPAPAPAPAAPAAPVVTKDLPLRLLGTVAGEGLPYAVIENLATHEQNLYRLNDIVLPDYTLAEIRRNAIVVKGGGSQYIFYAYPEDHPEPPPTPAPQASQPAAPPEQGGVRQVTPSRYVVDRRAVESELDNVTQLLTKARLVPNFTDGRPDGFRIFSIVPSSLFDRVGLQNGDVIQRINGVELKEPENFLRVFTQLRDQSRISIDLVRNNQRGTYDYEIR